MRPEIVDLIEAVRALGLRRTGKAGTRSVRISGDPKDFAELLATLQEKLELVDASGALADDDGPAAPRPDEIDRHRKALDGLLRFIQVRGLDLEAATDIVADALGVAGAAKSGKAFEILPKFAPKGWKKKKRLNPTLSLIPERPGDASLDDLRRIAFSVEATAGWMGSGFAKESRRLSEELDAMPTIEPTPPAQPGSNS